jgi:hypothetical protein
MPEGSPLNFAKLVYCMAYGEPFLLREPELVENNAGTPQYVDLLRDLCDFASGGSLSRLEHKAAVLRAFQKKGLWLLDASVHACYMGKKKPLDDEKRLPNKVVKQVIPLSWEKYVQPTVHSLKLDRSNIWVVGPTVHKLLRGRYINENNWIYQPNAQVSNAIRKQRLEMVKAAIREALEKK